MNILISGAGSGLGFETVRKLLTYADTRILALSRTAENLQRLLEAEPEAVAGGRLQILAFDIIKSNYISSLAPVLAEFMPQPDILINNAGGLINKPFIDTNTDDFRQMMEVNFYGHLEMTHFILPYLNPQLAHIVNIGSMGAFQGSAKFKGLAAYSASKAALMNFTECLATELNDQNIKVNGLALGSAQTDMLRKAFPGYEAPLSAAEMAAFIADFALTGHRFFNGKIIPVALMNV